MSLKEKIRSAAKVPPKALEVPEWGVVLYIPRKTVKERNDFEKSLTRLNKRSREEAMDQVRARLLIFGCRDEHGAEVWTVNDIEEIGTYDASVVDFVIAEIQKFTRISDADIDEMAKNLEGTPDGDLSGASV